MTQVAESIDTLNHRRLEPGSSGWTVHDLNEPAYESVWGREHVELVNGIIVTMPPAMFGGTGAGWNLLKILLRSDEFSSGNFMSEFDFLVSSDTVFRPDFVWLSQTDLENHKRQASKQGRSLAMSRLAVPPTLIIELVSQGLERHDRVLKFARYAEFGVPNYWVVDGFAKRFDCFVRKGTTYQLEAGGKNDEEIQPSLFAPLVIPLKDVWVD